LRAAAAAAFDARCASRTRARAAVSFLASSSASRPTSTAAECRAAAARSRPAASLYDLIRPQQQRRQDREAEDPQIGESGL
jgi:hypothetical protein